MEYKHMKDVNKLMDEMIGFYGIGKNSIEFYKHKIKRFFLEYMTLPNNIDKPLNAITYFDVNTHIKNLNCGDRSKSNNYYALKLFFQYTYNKGLTSEVISQVIKPTYQQKKNEVLDEEGYKTLKTFIVNKDNKINERLLLGLFLFTGLSRKYISTLRNNQFIFEDGVYKLIIWKEINQGDKENEEIKEVKLPLKAELQLIINEHFLNLDPKKQFEKVIDVHSNYISRRVSELTELILNKRCPPTVLINTFIDKALLNGNYIFEISKLTLENVNTIEKHIKDNDDNLINKQTSILNSF